MMTKVWPKFRKRRATYTRVTQSPPVATGPVLVSATYDASMNWLTLTFDRAVSISELMPGTATVLDGNLSGRFVNTSEFETVSPVAVTLVCGPDGEFVGEGVSLSATGATGIVDQAGTPWAGVTDVELPYP